MEKTALVKPALCVVAGHSGGHILPARTLAEQWLKANPKASCIFFSTNKKLDNDLLASSNIPLMHIPLELETFSLKKSWSIPPSLFKCISSCIQSYKILSKHKPQKIITTGGFVAIPVCIAARLLRIPIELYELNAVPGKAIRFLSSLAQTVYICFAQAQQQLGNKKCVLASYPLQSITQGTSISKKSARLSLGLHPTHTTVLILGGSQGSLFINNVIKKWLTSADISYKNIQIIHQTGSHDTTDWEKFYASHNITAQTFSYHDNVNQLYNAADIVICRSGAGSLFEVVHYKKPCITIPLESQADNHQVINALAIAEQYPELVTLIRQKEITNDIACFAKKLNSMLLLQQSSL